MKLAEEGLLDDFEERIREKLAQAQNTLDDGRDVPLFRAQGAKKALLDVLEMPEKILEQKDL